MHELGAYFLFMVAKQIYGYIGTLFDFIEF